MENDFLSFFQKWGLALAFGCWSENTGTSTIILITNQLREREAGSCLALMLTFFFIFYFCQDLDLVFQFAHEGE